MKSINSENDLLKSIMKLIARQFGDKCEIVLHDWSEGYDKPIVAIRERACIWAKGWGSRKQSWT